VLLALDQSPLEALLRAVDVERFAVLPRRVEQEPPDMSGNVGVLDLDVARLDGIRIARFLGQPLVDRPEPKQETYSAKPFTSPSTGDTTCVA
jgi:hypothetical protein